jgi:hypothetical protein
MERSIQSRNIVLDIIHCLTYIWQYMFPSLSLKKNGSYSVGRAIKTQPQSPDHWSNNRDVLSHMPNWAGSPPPFIWLTERIQFHLHAGLPRAVNLVTYSPIAAKPSWILRKTMIWVDFKEMFRQFNWNQCSYRYPGPSDHGNITAWVTYVAWFTAPLKKLRIYDGEFDKADSQLGVSSARHILLLNT